MCEFIVIVVLSFFINKELIRPIIINNFQVIFKDKTFKIQLWILILLKFLNSVTIFQFFSIDLIRESLYFKYFALLYLSKNFRYIHQDIDLY